MAAGAPRGSAESGWAPSLDGSLKAALAAYDAHRKTGDPERQSSHQNLYRTFCDTLTSISGEMNRRSKEKGIHIKLPSHEEEVEAAFKFILDGNWLYVCSNCGLEKRDKQEFWVSKDTAHVYCSDCVKQQTISCYHCKDRVVRGSVKSESLIKDNVAENTFHICSSCSSKDLVKGTRCTHCHCKYTGPAADNPEFNVTAEEIARQFKHHLCYSCASQYRKGECGHVDTRLIEIMAISNVEDDDRDREDVGRGYQRVCQKCANKAQHQEEGETQTWNASKIKCPTQTYDGLGSKRSFGVEIEVCQPKRMKPMPEDMKAYWTSKRDASLPEIGIELASTVLYGDAGLQVVRDLCKYASDNDWRVDTRAGLHIHVGLPGEEYPRLAAVAMGYHLTHDLWSSFVAPSRQRCKYCRKNSFDAADLVNKTPESLIHALLTDPSIEGRRCWVNWHSYSLHSTVEIRLHHGTLQYDKIANWAKAHTRFVDWCVAEGTHKAVYEALSGKTVRQQFLLITQEAWKDRDLGRWFRERAAKLFDGCAPLPESNRKLRLRGLDPKKYRPGFELKIKGLPVYICRLRESHYILADAPTANKGNVMSKAGWTPNGSGNPALIFSDRVQARNFVKDANSEGLEAAVSSFKNPKRVDQPNIWIPGVRGRETVMVTGMRPGRRAVARRDTNFDEL